MLRSGPKIKQLLTLQAEMKTVKQLKPKFEKIPAFVGIFFFGKKYSNFFATLSLNSQLLLGNLMLKLKMELVLKEKKGVI